MGAGAASCQKVVETRWVFNTKRNGEGGVVRRKSRLVVNGFTQIQENDFQRAYSPVSRYKSVRLMMKI